MTIAFCYNSFMFPYNQLLNCRWELHVPHVNQILTSQVAVNSLQISLVCCFRVLSGLASNNSGALHLWPSTTTTSHCCYRMWWMTQGSYHQSGVMKRRHFMAVNVDSRHLLVEMCDMAPIWASANHRSTVIVVPQIWLKWHKSQQDHNHCCWSGEFLHRL